MKMKDVINGKVYFYCGKRDGLPVFPESYPLGFTVKLTIKINYLGRKKKLVNHSNFHIKSDFNSIKNGNFESPDIFPVLKGLCSSAGRECHFSVWLMLWLAPPESFIILSW